MFIDIALLGLVFFLSIPTITAYFAYSYGRSFWRWFAIGCMLPILANFIIVYICRKEAVRAEKKKIHELSRYEDEWMERYIRDIMELKVQNKKKPDGIA